MLDRSPFNHLKNEYARIRTRLRIGNLQNQQTSELLRIKVQEELNVHDQKEVTDVESAWTHIKNTVKTASEEILGSQQGRKQEDWFRENEAVIKEILERKQNDLQAILRHPNHPTKADAFKTIKPHNTTEIKENKRSLVEA